MHNTIAVVDHNTRPTRRHPTMGAQLLWVRIGRGTFPFTSYADVSAAYRATIERLNLGVSETPSCEVLDSDGRKVAHVAYNGRVFAVDAEGETDRSIVLYETNGS